MAYKPTENYGVIGDLHTVALVGVDGSIDWCCLPHFDSPSVFAGILDDRKGGFFKIAPLH
jgi:GH15 family glucan-1,4-alpha-glucosidase